MEFIIHSYFSLLSLLSLGNPVDTVYQFPDELHEVSGMFLGQDSLLYAANDSGNEPIIYGVDVKGEIVRSVYIEGAKNIDWEEITTNDRFIFIGDFGNNSNNRKDLCIYKIDQRQFYAKDTVRAVKTTISYTNQKSFPAKDEEKNFDMEAMVVKYGTIYLFSKNRTSPFTGYTYLYSVPTLSGDYELSVEDSIWLGEKPKEMNSVTGAALSPDGRCLILLGYNKLWTFQDFWGEDFFSGYASTFHFDSFSQREAISFLNDTTLLISDEKNALGGQNLYLLNISEIRNELKVLREKEIEIKDRIFKKKIEFTLNISVKNPVYYSLINSNGAVVKSGRLGDFEVGVHNVTIPVEQIVPGAYILNLQVGHEKHGFIMRKFAYKLED